MAVERTQTEVAEIISTFLRGGGPAWAWDDFISIRIKDHPLTPFEPNAPLCQTTTRHRSPGTIAEKLGWPCFVLLLSVCAVPSYNRPLERTGFAGRSAPR